MIFHRLRPGRFLLCWAGAFVSLQIMFLLASLAWMVSSYETAFLSFGLLTAPFLTLLAGWIYFRPGFALAFSDRLHLILVWIILTMTGNTILFALRPGVPATDALSVPWILLEIVNGLCLFLAGYLAIPHKEKKRQKR